MTQFEVAKLLPILPHDVSPRKTIALVGNPNAGKTSLFNRLTGMRAKTANFPGTTVGHRFANVSLSDCEVTVIDLPGAYSLEALSPDEEVTRNALHGQYGGPPDLLLLVLDATNLSRNLFLVSQALELNIPTVVALNMIDMAEVEGIDCDSKQLAEELGCRVIPISARTGRNIDELLTTLGEVLDDGRVTHDSQSVCVGCSGCQFKARYDWADAVTSKAIRSGEIPRNRHTEAIDHIVTHPIVGLLCFAAVMVFTFMLIFWLASYPMEWMDALFALASETVARWLPPGDLSSLITDGIIGGVGGMLVFLPQIFILFFLITLLEDSGYLARAAFVMDKLMHRVGLPGKAFVPMLAAHACAIPAIMASRVIGDTRDRLNTILVLPLLTCSARLPVFAMVIALMFPDRPLYASLTFAGAYVLAIVTALLLGFVFKKTLLPGRTKPLVIELPPYRRPSLWNALLSSLERSRLFVRKAGTVILLFSLGLWVIATYPKSELGDLPAATQTQIASAEQAGDFAEMDRLFAQAASERSLAGRMGRAIQPVFEPLGFDWRLTVGVINSFAAREVIVSTLAVLYGSVDEEEGLLNALDNAKQPAGGPVFTLPTCFSLLVFYIYAMQCLPTLAVVRREVGTWKWPVFQLVYMSVLAYVAALITYNIASLFV